MKIRVNIDRQAVKAVLFLGLVIGIVTLSGCVGQEDEETTPITTTTTTVTLSNTPTTGISVTLTFQPNPMIPTRTTSYTLTDYRIHSSWSDAITDDGNATYYRWNAGQTYAYNQIFWEWDVGYPDAMKQLTYEVEVSTEGTIHGHALKIAKHDGGKSTIFSMDFGLTANGTWTELSEIHWLNGKVYAHYGFEEDYSGLYFSSTSFDVMVLEFNPITEEHLTTRQITETGVYDVIFFTVNQDDVTVTISGIPTGYQLIQITPENSYLSVSNDIASSGSLTIESCSLGMYKVVLKTPD